MDKEKNRNGLIFIKKADQKADFYKKKLLENVMKKLPENTKMKRSRLNVFILF